MTDTQRALDKLRESIDEALQLDWANYAAGGVATDDGRDAVRIDALFDARARIAALEQALRAIRKCVTTDADGEFWSARNWLDKAKIYHDNLSGIRVVEEVCKAALAHGEPGGAR